jgi:hypothetical protein
MTPYGSAPAFSRGQPAAKSTKRCFIRYLSAGRKAIAYTDLLATVAYSNINLGTATSDNGIYSPI